MVLGYFLATWEAEMESQAPGFSLAQPPLAQVFGE